MRHFNNDDAGDAELQAWLTRHDLRRVNHLIDTLTAILTQARDPSRGELFTVTMVLAPRLSRSGRRARKAA